MNRREVRAAVLAACARHVSPVLDPAGFRLIRRDEAYVRSRPEATATIRLGLSSRPASLGRRGILIEPTITMDYPAWLADVGRWAPAGAGSDEFGPEPPVFEILDDLVPGKRPLWTLPDDPQPGDIERVVRSIGDGVKRVALPFIQRIETPALMLSAFELDTVRVMHEGRMTVAVGALLARREDLARKALAGFGTVRREAAERALGLRPGD